MGKRQVEQYEITDDWTGESLPEDSKPYHYEINGKRYEVYLSDKSKAEVDGFIERLTSGVEPQRLVSFKKGARAATTAKPKRNDLMIIRAWAKENGYDVSERGRISKEIQDAYDAAH